jgi:DNA-binding NtrC family response regulator
MSHRAPILILDDEVIVCERLKEYLGEKFEVETFTDSTSALERLGQKRFDVVVTDLKMKGPTGLDVLRFVRDHSRGTQVIIITGYGSFEAAREAEYSGVYDFVPKPFDMKKMEAMIRSAANKARKVPERQPE